MSKIKKYLLVLAPFLTSAFFVVYTFNYNYIWVSLDQLWRPLAVALVVTAVVFLISLLAWRNINKAVFTAFFLMVLFWNYDVLGGFFVSLEFVNLQNRHVMPLLIFVLIYLCIFLFAFLKKKKLDVKTFNLFTCIIAAILLGFNSVQIAAREIQARNAPPLVRQPIDVTPAGNPDFLPNIYFIIFDSASDLYVMETFFDFDTTDFRNFLSENRFHIVEYSRSMHLDTMWAIPSFLNLEWIPRDTPANVALELANNSKLVEILNDMGYSTIAITPVIAGSIPRRLDDFDIRIYYTLVQNNNNLVPFEDHLLQRSIIYPVRHILNPNRLPFTLYEQLFHETLFFLDTLSSFTPNEDSPAFVYSHILIPHSPLTFDADGTPLTQIQPMTGGEHMHAYVPTYAYMIERIKEITTNILHRDDNAVIIIMADHGARFSPVPRPYMYRVLNIIRLPEGFEYPVGRLSSVNTLRFIMNTLFGMDFDIIEEDFYNYE